MPRSHYQSGEVFLHPPCHRKVVGWEREADIDILAFEENHESALFAACKSQAKPSSLAEYHHVLSATAIIKEPTGRSSSIFSTGGYTDEVKKQVTLEGVTLVNLDDLFYL